jgi:hypothetical protein
MHSLLIFDTTPLRAVAASPESNPKRDHRSPV